MVEPISKEQAMREGFDIQSMMQSPGWAVIVSEANERIKIAINQLQDVDPTEAGKVMNLQHQIKALKWLLTWPVTVANQAQELEKAEAEETQPEA